MNAGRLASTVASIALLVATWLGPTPFSDARFLDSASVGSNVFETSSWCSSDMYVAGQQHAATSKPSGYWLDVTITVRRTDCSGGPDVQLEGVSLTVELRDASGALVNSASGVTGAQGDFIVPTMRKLPAGTYDSMVVSMSHPSFAWSQALDQENPYGISLGP